MNIQAHPMDFLAAKDGGPDHQFDEFRFWRVLRFLREVKMLHYETLWLDLGCAKGEFNRFIDEQLGCTSYGCDNWTDALGPRYFCADLETGWPQRISACDVISALEVIEHITDTDAFLWRAQQNLKPGGWLVLTTPNINSLRNRVLVPFGVYPAGLEWHNVIHHVRLYNPSVLAAQLIACGFSNVCVRGISFLPLHGRWGTSSLSRWLANLFPSLCNNFIVIAQKGA